MQVGILATDGGPHPPDKWARMSAMMIVQHVVPTMVAVGDETHDVERSAHPVVTAFRKARDKFEAEVRDGLESLFEEHMEMARRGAHPQQNVEAHVASIAAIAERHHPALHAHLLTDEAGKALAHRLRMDLDTIRNIEHDWRASGHVVDENHRAVKAPAN